MNIRYEIIPPPLSLAEYVQFFWILEGDQAYEHRSLADGGVEMIFHYQGAFDEVKPNGKCPSALSSIQGSSSTYQVYTCQSSFGIFGVYFYPFAIPVLFDMPANELSNEMPDLIAFLGVEGRYLEERMICSRTNAERINMLSAFLETKLKNINKRDNGLHSVIRSMIHSRGKIDIDLAARDCCLSRRQFERKFRALAGFSPKMYERITRFQNAADEYKNHNKSLTQIALENGYYDHSHFSNDFKKFSGHNPKDYFSGKEVGHEWRECEIGMSQFSKN